MRKTAIIIVALYFLMFGAQCFAATPPLSEDELIATAKYIQELTAENESLKKQIAILEDGMSKSDILTQNMMGQIQAWTALQESRNKQADEAIKMLVETLNTVEVTVDKFDKKAQRAEGKTEFWRGVSAVLTVGLGVALASD